MNQLPSTIAWLFATGFAAAALLGFIPNPIVGEGALFVTNTAHNLVHLISAFGFAVAALIGDRFATRFMLVFGGVYALTGLIGFFVLAGAPEGHLLGIVHINVMDNFLHMALGIAIAIGGVIAWRSGGDVAVQTH